MLDSSNASAATWREIHLTCNELSNGRAGVRAVATATSPDGADRLRSVLERLARKVLLTHEVPEGDWNRQVKDAHGRVREVDLCYPQARLIVEFDGLRFHMRRHVARKDRATDRRLQLAGWTVLRFTWEDIVFRPEAVANEIKQALTLT
jgi:very-short-patch-repair endonuclease